MAIQGFCRRLLLKLTLFGGILGCLFLLSLQASAQTPSSPSAFCHITDGAFTNCSDGNQEWSDVTPQFFPDSGSYLYVDQADLDPNLSTPSSPVDTLMLMYDECRSTRQLGPNEYVRVGFTTVELEDGAEVLEHYVIHIFKDGTIIFLENGTPQRNAAGAIRVAEIEGQRGSVGFGLTPQCPTPHVFAEFEIKLSATGVALNGGYSPDPQFWGAQAPCDFKCVARRAAVVKGLISSALWVGATQTFFVCAWCNLGAAIFALDTGIFIAINEFDPPDPNFRVLAEPQSPVIPPITPGTGVTPEAADALNALLNDDARLSGLLDAWLASVERVDGARSAGDTFWVNAQLQHAAALSTQAAEILRSLPLLLTTARERLLAGGFPAIPVTPADVSEFQADVAANGLPASTLEVFGSFSPQAFGVTTELLLNAVREKILLLDPREAAGSIPERLTDPNLLTLFQELAIHQEEFARSVPGFVAPIRPGFDGNILPRNDDGSTGLVPLGFSLNFFGTTYQTLFVNNNGNVTFDNPLSTFTPFPLTSTNRAIIAPFFADVDTRVANVVTYGQGTVNGHPAFGVNWPGVGCYNQNGSVLNFFQMRLIDRSDVAPGDFDIVFGYDSIQWETGQASGGNVVCQGGASARVGYSNGTGLPGTFFELPGSGIPGAFLDSNLQTGLRHQSPLGFSVRSGVPVPIVDRDGDGVPDDLDNCPTAPNPDQADRNFNGIGDFCELGGTNSTAAFLQADVDGDTTVEPRPLPFAQEPTLLEKLVRIVEFRVEAGLTNSAAQLTQNLVESLVEAGLVPPGKADELVNDVLQAINQPPICSVATPSVSQLWPPNHQSVPVSVLDVTDPDGDPVTITIDSIFQDEAVNAAGSGNTCPDAAGVGTATAQVLAERVGNGNGRVYHISFTADDGQGGTCEGEIAVCVPHDQGQGSVCVDQGSLFDSTVCP